MIKHIVCFKLKNRDDAPKAKETLLSMEGRVPQLRSIEVGIDKLHSERSYDVILQVTVDSIQALEDYQKDEYHCSVVKPFMHAVRETSVAVDYEI
ncbi:MAG: Dabb family protein [Clostridia bacterium]|nr:Dabb family protein [Clostridia bacterium]